MMRSFLLMGSLLLIVEINNSACSQSHTTAITTKKAAAEKDSDDIDSMICGIGWEPQYPGGDPAIRKFIFQHTRYPKAALKEKISGKVIVQFIVDTLGNTKDISIAFSTNNIFNKEAARVISLLHGWKFSRDAAGRRRELYLKQPLTFKMPDEIKNRRKKSLPIHKKKDTT